jgi:hypothetical protein
MAPRFFRSLSWLVFCGCFTASSLMAAESLFDRQVAREAGGAERTSLFDAATAGGVPEEPLREAFEYFDQHQAKITNQRYLTIVDYSLPNKKERLFVIDLASGEVERRLVSHGAGRGDRSNPRDLPIYFSNTPDSRENSIGFYITGSDYPSPSFERALNLLGQEPTNDNAYKRRIVFHGANYVDEEKGVVGRSWGCPAVDNRHAFRLIDQLKDGSLFYIVAGEVQ